MLWRRPYQTQVQHGPTLLVGEGLVVGVLDWEGITQAELWHRLRDRDAPGVAFEVRLFMAPDDDQLAASVPPSRIPVYQWHIEWPYQASEVVVCVPRGSLTVFGPPTEDAWETVLRSLGEAQR